MKTIIIMALIGGFIGYITNAVAVYLLFRPYRKIGPFQGLVPRRKAELAASIGRTIENELIDLGGIINNVVQELDLNVLKKRVGQKISHAMQEELPTLIPASLIDNLVMKYIDRRGDELFQGIILDLTENTGNLKIVSRHVEEKIMEFELEKLEKIVYDVSRTELQFIIWLGGILGLIIGIVQGILAVYVL